MSYGQYSFAPIPLISFQNIFHKGSDGSHLTTGNAPPAYTVKATLNGTLTNIYPTGEGNNFAYSIVDVMGAQTGLYNALSHDGQFFLLKCNDVPLFSGYPKINNYEYNPTNNNWVMTTNYSVEMDFEEWVPLYPITGVSGVVLSGRYHNYVSSAQDEWQLECIDDRSFYNIFLASGVYDSSPVLARLTHNVSANGICTYGPTGNKTPGWENAQNYVREKICSTEQNAAALRNAIAPNVINLVGQIPFNHLRTQSVDEINGTCSVSESWLIADPTDTSGWAGYALEDYNASVNYSIENNLTTVNIDGTIVGLESRYYDYPGGSGTNLTILASKYETASSYWSSVQSKLLPRAQSLAGVVNTVPFSTTIGKSPSQGTVTYSYVYNNRPSNCITGALSESVTITDNNPTDVIAQLSVLGRKAGPVLQSIGTKTPRTRDLSIELIMPPSTGCGYAQLYGSSSTNPRDLAETWFLCPMETEMTGGMSQIFITNDNETWNPKTGRYSRSVTWLFQNCNDTTTPSVCGSSTNEDVI